jgi:hypothetical protein
MNVELVESEITLEHTATLEFNLENITNKPLTRSNTLYKVYPTGGVKNLENEKNILLTVNDFSERGARKTAPRCWRPDRSSTELHGAGVFPHNDLPKDYKLVPGEIYSTKREIWAPPDSNHCIESGHYKDRAPFELESEDGGVDMAFSWGFDLKIE